jgi:hypothetical protein
LFGSISALQGFPLLGVLLLLDMLFVAICDRRPFKKKNRGLFCFWTGFRFELSLLCDMIPSCVFVFTGNVYIHKASALVFASRHRK